MCYFSNIIRLRNRNTWVDWTAIIHQKVRSIVDARERFVTAGRVCRSDKIYQNFEKKSKTQQTPTAAPSFLEFCIDLITKLFAE